MRKCINCGAKIKKGETGCSKCGMSLSMSNISEKLTRNDVNEKTPKGIPLAPKPLALLSIAIIVAATFLPFMVYDFVLVEQGYTLWYEEFRVATIVCLVVLAFDIIEILFSTKHMGRDTFFIGCIVGIVAYIQYMSNKEKLSELSEQSRVDFSSILSPGPGFYLILLGAVGLMISGIWLGKSCK